ncbi:hypothetical protein DOE52_02965 [Porphyromonas gingivalis]|nr:hypothetical protein CLI83_00325 [Porphyromonas gingivalis]PDP66912.1 hypothetical protein CLI78_01945 [Porphyromonas gingivalis]RRG14189.1 hypothetical protein DOE52_02965 [Porphyromonas gingivalis]
MILFKGYIHDCILAPFDRFSSHMVKQNRPDLVPDRIRPIRKLCSLLYLGGNEKERRGRGKLTIFSFHAPKNNQNTSLKTWFGNFLELAPKEKNSRA